MKHLFAMDPMTESLFTEGRTLSPRKSKTMERIHPKKTPTANYFPLYTALIVWDYNLTPSVQCRPPIPPTYVTINRVK